MGIAVLLHRRDAEFSTSAEGLGLAPAKSIPVRIRRTCEARTGRGAVTAPGPGHGLPVGMRAVPGADPGGTNAVCAEWNQSDAMAYTTHSHNKDKE